jgi:hypothetical protein
MVMAQLVAEAGTDLLVGDTAMYPYIPLEEDDAMLLGRSYVAAGCDRCVLQSRLHHAVHDRNIQIVTEERQQLA